MRAWSRIGLALALIATVVMAAAAADEGKGKGKGRGKGRGGFGGGGIVGLTAQKSIQEELKMDKDQVDKATEAAKKFREDNKDDLAKLFSRETSDEDRAAVRKKVEEAGAKALADVLKPEQIKRLKQIRTQLSGVSAFTSADTQAALKLTDKQKDELKELSGGMRKEMREIFQTAREDREAAHKKMNELRKTKMDAALKVLTDDQKKTWAELTGAPFKGELTMGFGGGRGGRRGPEGNKPDGNKSDSKKSDTKKSDSQKSDSK